MHKHMLRAAFNPGARFVILFHNLQLEANGTIKSRENFTEELFTSMYTPLNAARVILLYATDYYTYNLYVSRPYRSTTHCGKFDCIQFCSPIRTLNGTLSNLIKLGKFTPIMLDVCDKGVLKNISKSTRARLRDTVTPETLPQCTFKFCGRVSDPYVNEDCRTGLEVSIIDVLQDKFKFKVRQCLSVKLVINDHI